MKRMQKLKKLIFLGAVLGIVVACSLPRGAALVQEVVRETRSQDPSFQVVPVTRAALPDEIRSLGHKHRHHLDYEIEEDLMKDAKAVERLRKASST